MDQYIQMTQSQVQDTLNAYRAISKDVRLVEYETLKKIEKELQNKVVCGRESCLLSETCDFFEDRKCLCLEAFHNRETQYKFVTYQDKVYQVIARYIEIEGKPGVIEIVQFLQDALFSDHNEKLSLLKKVDDYEKEMYRDSLTKAYNRRFYDEKMKMQKITGGVALIDVDNFKHCNDRYGHRAGDVALITVTKVMNSCIRKGDYLMRIGGDEFVLVLPGATRSVFLEKLKYIDESLMHVQMEGFQDMHITASIGGVMAEHCTVRDAVSRADDLMYKAKENRNTVVLEDAIVHFHEDRNTSRLTILVADDAEMNQELLKVMLGNNFDILSAYDGEQAIHFLETQSDTISLVLLDLFMPKLDGFGVLKWMGKKQLLDRIPVIMVSSEEDPTNIHKCYELGAVDYIPRPFDMKVVYQRVMNTVKLYSKQKQLMELVSQQQKEDKANMFMLITILSHIVEFRNGESGAHVLHIDVITRLLLQRLVEISSKYDLPKEVQERIVLASSLHDIGKIDIPSEILNKPGRLTKEEFEIMKTHTTTGAYILDELTLFRDNPLVKIAHDICLWHHERYDGKGYPDGLKGDQIPISAQVVSLADVYDALTSERIYKPAYSHEKALEMIFHGECGQFNPILLQCLQDIQHLIPNEIALVDESMKVDEGEIPCDHLKKHAQERKEKKNDD